MAVMQWLDAGTTNCSVQRTLDVIGEKWTLLILRDAMNGVRRFDDFHRHVGLSEPTLAARLRTLVGSGILETREYQPEGQRARHEYRLTAKGWGLQPVLIALMQWGDEHLADAAGPALTVAHRDCGHPVRAVVSCSHDGEVLTPREVVATPGPGASPA
jgi:DNA-binding HxlR family transcriptional regulator